MVFDSLIFSSYINSLDNNKYLFTCITIILLIELIIISVEDIKHNIIPERFCKITFATGVLAIVSGIFYSSWQTTFSKLINHLFASILAITLMTLIKKISDTIFKTNTLGIGDAKLASIGGIWLGIKGIYIAMTIAFISASIYSLFMIIKGYFKKLQAYAFAPFISLGVFFVWIFGENWWIQKWWHLWEFKL